MRKTWLLSVLFVGLHLSADAGPSQRKMLWLGWWQTGNQEKVAFEWRVNESNECCAVWNIQITGSAKDMFGESQLSGYCAEARCVINQFYTSGKFKGRTYIYSANAEPSADGRGLKSVSGNYQLKNGSAAGIFQFDRFEELR